LLKKFEIAVSSSLTPVTNTSSISTISTQQTSTTKRASNITTTTQQATTTSTYTPAGPCTYSAIYQTSFKGNKLLKRILVSRGVQNFMKESDIRFDFSQIPLKQLYISRDALIDYRTPNVLGFDSTSVYFDGIRCEGVKS
uniref:SUN domain-containing protein n=1 Tax=Toxocara canis TaxID=6265 RepID=A0A183UPE9_TOXCA